VTAVAAAPRETAEVLEETVRALAADGVSNARAEAREIVARAIRRRPGELDLRARDPWPSSAESVRAALAAQRAAGWPLAYLLGEWDFRDTTLTVTPDVLIPRPETEELFDRVERTFVATAPVAAADIGTGAGGLAIALARRWPSVRVTAVDVSRAALAVARWNARRWAVESRIDFREDDLAGGLPPASMDLIVANLPYVADGEWTGLSPEVRREPRGALLGGPDGLALFRRFAPGAAAALAPGGRVFLEVGRGQTKGVADLLSAAGFRDLWTDNDAAGVDRFVGGTR